VTTTTVTRLAMATAGCMLGHQVASKAVRDAAFLMAWPTRALPIMVIVAAAVVVAAVPVFARLLDRFGSRAVMSAGFLLSAGAHLIEWRLSSGRPWVAVLIYLHVAGLGALLLSGYWSLVSERFDPRSARENFGRIAAAGTLGGAAGGLAAERIAMALSANSVLVLLAALHVLCAAGAFVLGRARVLLAATDAAPSDHVFAFKTLRDSPHFRTIALIVLLTTAGAGVLDFLLKWRVTQEFGAGPYLLRFFAFFYAAVQIGSFIAQAGTSHAVQRLGIGRTISILPAGVAATGAVALLFPVWQVLVGVRGIEAVLRGSLFRSAYELLFVPMDVSERRHVKTFLDVTCDRAGEAIGAVIVQLLLLTSLAFFGGELVAVAILLAVASLWLGRRLDRLYLDAVVQQLVKHADVTPVIVGSQAGWTVVDLVRPVGAEDAAPKPAPRSPAAAHPRRDDPRMRILSELRSGDRARVEAALGRLSTPDRLHVAQIIDLLAWDDLVASARRMLERVAPAHVGLLVDALLDPDTDFAVRRRVPRILCTVGSDRSLDGLVRGLDDTRFEVRYQCSRAIDRILMRNPSLAVDAARMMTMVERELSVPQQIWQGHRLIDQPDRDEPTEFETVDLSHRNLEHVFSMLAAVLPREPLQVALRGLSSSNAGLRGLALEYLESVLQASILQKLRQLLDAPLQQAPDRTTPERALEQLRASTEAPVVKAPSEKT
jgi:ATP:ADP antiporter, AAA family